MEYVRIDKIIFEGRQNIKWDEVEKYLKKYVGMSFTVKEYNDTMHINSLFANEYAESQYTKRLRGGLAKVKANIVQELPKLIENAINRRWIENKDDKHLHNAAKGWYRYDIYFGMPVRAENEEKMRWNLYTATMVARINDHGLYLYDIINIKKEASTPREFLLEETTR